MKMFFIVSVLLQNEVGRRECLEFLPIHVLLIDLLLLISSVSSSDGENPQCRQNCQINQLPVS